MAVMRNPHWSVLLGHAFRTDWYTNMSSLSRPFLCFWLVFISLLFPPKSDGQSRLVERPKRPLFLALKMSDLSADNIELAEQLEILPLLTKLYDPTYPKTPVETTAFREKILETILESYFDAVSVQAEADREQGKLEALLETLIFKRDRAIELNNATNFLASGTLNTVGSILGFSAKTPPLPGNLNQMLSGVVSMGMSSYSLRQNYGSKARGEGSPTVLAELFGRPTDLQTSYPESVWRFFHGKVPGRPDLTRAQLLENTWITRGYLEPHGSPRESLKIDLVCGVATHGKTMTMGDLSDQLKMIADVSTVTEFMSHHLRDLLRMIDSDVLSN